ncbi:MAG: arsenic efflux protein [Clostridia bacterium]|nr:arsenic efflux protein [Clostridia bacterium]
MWHKFLHSVEHAAVDTLPILPWLILIYIVIELLENKTNLAKGNRLGGRLGPLVGSATGLIPQCGFSVLAAKLFEQKYITVGTLIAIFLSTSDEAFIVLLSSGAQGAAVVLPIIAVKVLVGVAVGYAVDGALKLVGRGQVRLDVSALASVTGEKKPQTVHEIFMLRYYEGMAIEEGCSCGREHEEGKPFKTYVLNPLLHSLKVAAFILLVNFVLTFLIELVGEERFAALISGNFFLQPFLAAAIGLIPNCASSVVITTSYLEGGIAFGSCVAGLCANAGLGFVVLLKNTRRWKRNLLLIAVCYAVAVVVGLILNALPLPF